MIILFVCFVCMPLRATKQNRPDPSPRPHINAESEPTINSGNQPPLLMPPWIKLLVGSNGITIGTVLLSLMLNHSKQLVSVKRKVGTLVTRSLRKKKNREEADELEIKA